MKILDAIQDVAAGVEQVLELPKGGGSRGIKYDVTIDSSPALAVDGVVAVFTAEDIPGELRVGLIHKDWPVMIPQGGRTSYLGDVLAIVVAHDRPTAVRAADLVRVEYQVHTPKTIQFES